MSEKIDKQSDGEEGEIEDSDNEEVPNSLNCSGVSKSDLEVKNDMELESEDEDGKINVKPIAMSVTFYKDKHKERFTKELIEKFGSGNVESSNSCLFVYPEQSSKEIVRTVVAPSGILRILFHDEEFRDKYLLPMISICDIIFGKWKVTSDDASIDVFEEDILEFEVDTSTRSRSNIIYNKLPNKEENRRNNSMCFNCGGGHNLQSCPEPKNFQRINENREIFKTRKTQSNKRYHFERDQFSGSAPGHLSAGLRKALGVQANQIPRFIYQMRKFGYPPAWLLEAKIKHSGVAVYGSDGAIPEEGDETGEVFEEGEKDRYDMKKLISFPGFNAPLPEDAIDEHEQYLCPALSEDQSLEAMKQVLAPNAYQAYKKRKSIVTDSPNTSISNAEKVEGMAKRETAEEPILNPKPLSVNLGTPVLPPTSPFSKLPERNKFGTNISDVINFENLPDSTGTYERVSTSISKIREFAAKNSD